VNRPCAFNFCTEPPASREGAWRNTIAIADEKRVEKTWEKKEYKNTSGGEVS